MITIVPTLSICPKIIGQSACPKAAGANGCQSAPDGSDCSSQPRAPASATEVWVSQRSA
jgi:hypothetical protein